MSNNFTPKIRLHQKITAGGISCRLRFGLAVLLLPLAGCSSHPKAATLAFIGDINLGRYVRPQADSLADLAPELQGADLALANLESPLSSPGSTPVPAHDLDLCAPSEEASLLARWGLDLLALANNHALDCSQEGVEWTASILETAGLTPVLPGFAPVVRKLDGLSLSFFAFDDVLSPLEEDRAVQAVQKAHASGQLVIISIHWGMEYQGGASVRQKQLALVLAEAGADLIWGTHPHVLQRTEWIGTGHQKTLVLYSLGNALFDQEGLADTRRSALIEVKIDPGGVESFQAFPFLIDAARSRVMPADAESAAKIMDRLAIP